MKLKQWAESVLALYGILTAIDKFISILHDGKVRDMERKIKREKRRHRSFTDYERFSFETKDKAYGFYEQMKENIDREGYVTVSDVYDANNRASTLFDTKVGWYHLYDDEIKIKKSNGRWYIKLPRPTFITERGFK